MDNKLIADIMKKMETLLMNIESDANEYELFIKQKTLDFINELSAERIRRNNEWSGDQMHSLIINHPELNNLRVVFSYKTKIVVQLNCDNRWHFRDNVNEIRRFEEWLRSLVGNRIKSFNRVYSREGKVRFNLLFDIKPAQMRTNQGAILAQLQEISTMANI